MTAPDCPFGVNDIPNDDEKNDGLCILDGGPCWHSKCPSGNWTDQNTCDKGFLDKRGVGEPAD